MRRAKLLCTLLVGHGQSALEGRVCLLKRHFLNTVSSSPDHLLKQPVLLLRNCLLSVVFKDKHQRMNCGFINEAVPEKSSPGQHTQACCHAVSSLALKWPGYSEALVVWHLIKHLLVCLFPKLIPEDPGTAISSPPSVCSPLVAEMEILLKPPKLESLLRGMEACLKASPPWGLADRLRVGGGVVLFLSLHLPHRALLHRDRVCSCGCLCC